MKVPCQRKVLVNIKHIDIKCSFTGGDQQRADIPSLSANTTENFNRRIPIWMVKTNARNISDKSCSRFFEGLW